MKKNISIVILLFYISLGFSQQQQSHDTISKKIISQLNDKEIHYNNKIDSSLVMLSDKQIEKIAREFKQDDIMSPGMIAILAALIGALSAILSQIVIYLLNNNDNKKTTKLRLLTEERRLSVLLIEFHKEIALFKVNASFWYRGYCIRKDDGGEDCEDYYQQYIVFRDRISECQRRISETLAEYSKVVTNFMHVVNKESPFFEHLTSLRTFASFNEKPSEFEHIKTIEELSKEGDIELIRLESEFLKCSQIFDAIYTEMREHMKTNANSRFNKQ